MTGGVTVLIETAGCAGFSVLAAGTGVLPRYAFRLLALGSGPAGLMLACSGRGPWWLAVMGPAVIGCVRPPLRAGAG